MAPFMEPGSVKVPTWQESRRLRNQTGKGKISFAAALGAYREHMAAQADARLEVVQSGEVVDGRSTPEVDTPRDVSPPAVDPLDLAAHGSQSLGTAGQQVVLRPRRRTVSRRRSPDRKRSKDRNRKPSRITSADREGSVRLMSRNTVDRKIQALRAMADARPFRPRSVRQVSPAPSGDDYEEETSYQKVPVPTAFTGDFDTIAKSADQGTAEDLAAAIEATTRDEGRNLLPPDFVDLTMTPVPPPPDSLQPSGTVQVSLSESSAEDSSSSEVEAAVDEGSAAAANKALEAARAALALAMSEGRDDAAAEAEEALAAAKRAATEHMELLD